MPMIATRRFSACRVSSWFCVLSATVAVLAAPASASADGFVSPSIGFNFGSGFADCQTVTDCQTHRANYGMGIGYLGPLVGFEEEFVYTPSFFGSSSASTSNNVLTLMSNVFVNVPLGPIRPYGTIGLGLLRTSVDFTVAGLASVRNSGLGWDVGGGLFVNVMPHISVRADLRHYRGTGDLNIAGLSLQGSPLNFSRASAALVLKF